MKAGEKEKYPRELADGDGNEEREWVGVFSPASLSIRCPQIHRDYSLNYKTNVRYLASQENILSRNVFKVHAKEASTFIYPFPFLLDFIYLQL